MRLRLTPFLLTLTWSCYAASPSITLLTNAGFEQGFQNWRPLWCREEGAGSFALDQKTVHSGTQSVRIEHRGAQDWSFEPEVRVTVRAGEIFELDAWIQAQGSGTATLCFSTWDNQGRNVAWSESEETAGANHQWQHLQIRMLVPAGVAEIQPRLIGHGPATVWIDDCGLVQRPGMDSLRSPNLPAELALTNPVLVLRFETVNATLSVLDRRTGRLWQQAQASPDVVVTAARESKRELEVSLLHVPSQGSVGVTLELDKEEPEFTCRLSGSGKLSVPFHFPYPFVTEPGDRLIVPMNEGISYPVEDESIEPMRLIAYGGHGICMAFWGVTHEQEGQMAIIESPDDAAIQIGRVEHRLAVAPEWQSQKGQWGYPRQLRYVFFKEGGHVAIAKRYRKYVQQKGLLKTLAQKRQENPNVDLLVGAVNVWNWDSDPVNLVKEMQAAGIERILWSRGGSPQALRGLNELHVLTSRYDIYQDVMDPSDFAHLRWIHPDWTTAAWPKDIVRGADGNWLKGWGVQGTNGQWYSCGVVCDRRAVDYARKRIPAELATHDYECRFIDTTTASPWHECYSTNHPMTRSESREWKMKLLEYVSRDMKLVTGCETGHDAAVPFLHYFEGMLSLGPYRVPDAGRDMLRIWKDPPEVVSKFQLGQKYRLPLWELVFHDCVVAQWYWGDYNNKLPSLWDKRDLFNLLYGTPPMFMFNRKLWHEQRGRFVQSYRNTCPYVRAVGYSEMIDHRFLTPDRNVQQTAFANGVIITVNFGDKPYEMASGLSIPPLGFWVGGMPATGR